MELIRFLAEVLELKKSHIYLDKVFVKIHTFPTFLQYMAVMMLF